MEFDTKVLNSIKEGLATTTELLIHRDPEKLREAGDRLEKLTYDLETVAKYGSSISLEEAGEIVAHIDTTQVYLSDRVEAGDVPKDIIEFTYSLLSRLINVRATLGYYLSKY